MAWAAVSALKKCRHMLDNADIGIIEPSATFE